MARLRAQARRPTAAERFAEAVGVVVSAPPWPKVSRWLVGRNVRWRRDGLVRPDCSQRLEGLCRPVSSRKRGDATTFGDPVKSYDIAACGGLISRGRSPHTQTSLPCACPPSTCYAISARLVRGAPGTRSPALSPPHAVCMSSSLAVIRRIGRFAARRSTMRPAPHSRWLVRRPAVRSFP